jgi:benzodiazapine receptor
MSEKGGRSDVVRQVVVAVCVVITIALNSLANILPFNNLTTGEISDRFTVYFVPAGYVFSIWGLIYLFLIGFAVYQALPSQRTNPWLRRIGYLFVASCVANVAWLFLWHYERFVLTLIAMFALLLLLISIYLILSIGRRRVGVAELLLVHVPFSVYLGWVTVAAVANVTSVLDYVKWSGWGISPQAWAIIMLVIAAAIASLVSITRGDIAYVAVIVWAFVGIAIKHSAVPIVAIAAWVLAAVVALTLIVGLPRRKRRLQPA